MGKERVSSFISQKIEKSCILLSELGRADSYAFMKIKIICDTK